MSTTKFVRIVTNGKSMSLLARCGKWAITVPSLVKDSPEVVVPRHMTVRERTARNEHFASTFQVVDGDRIVARLHVATNYALLVTRKGTFVGKIDPSKTDEVVGGKVAFEYGLHNYKGRTR
jgi:hypothetical protein